MQRPSNPGLAQQLTRETREAAGEDKAGQDDTTGFKMSPSVSWIAHKLGISTEAASFICFLLNFLVTAGVIVWASRKYLPGAFKARTAAIQKAMQEAQQSGEDARRKLAEIESRLKKLNVEIGLMRDSVEKEAVAEEARIRAAAQEDAHKITESARQEIEAAAKAARRRLSAYAADLAVSLAQKQIRVDADTDQKLVRNFAGQLSASSSESGLERASRKDRN
jgi:F-type H+-transporting ATPase subunit b